MQNYLLKQLVALVMSGQVSSMNEFVKKTGQSFKEHEETWSSSAAVVVVSDFALDYPRPLPPKVHVSEFICSASQSANNIYVATDSACML